MSVEAFWDERFSGPQLAYGEAPNDFLVEVTARLPRGRALSLGEGEGRNAMHLARQGYAVTALDASSAGLARARARAEAAGLRIETVHADLSTYALEPASWDVIVSVFCHLPMPLRRAVHRAAAKGLRPGGAFVLEAYTPAQLAHGTGGPKDVSLLYTLDDLREDLAGLSFEIAVEKEREIHEGVLHNGMSAVVQVLAFAR
ncbi:MAG: class I SAM-dependent methyltransferase [Polyangiales bacterium]